MNPARSAVLLSLAALGATTANAQFVEPVGALFPCDVFPGGVAYTSGALPGDPPSFEDPSQWHVYTFEGAAGQIIDFEIAAQIPELDPILALWQGDPTGVLLSSFIDATSSSDGSITLLKTLGEPAPAPRGGGPYLNGLFDDAELPADGTYFFIVAGYLTSNPGAGEGAYAYAITAISHPTITNTTQGGAYLHIQDAINAANDFDVLELGCGKIIESGIVVDRPVTIVGAGQESTIIEGFGFDRVFTVEDAADGAVFRDFTVSTGDTPSFGGGFLLKPGSQSSMQRVRITGCESNGGGAMWIDGGTPGQATRLNASNCVFDFNSSLNVGAGGGIGGAIASTMGDAVDATFVNCLFSANSADGDGAAIVTDGAGKVVRLINCTLVNNATTNGSTRLLQTCCGGVFTIVNSIIGANGADDITDFSASGTTLARSHVASTTLLNGVIETDINFLGDPMFVDPMSGDFRLQEANALIDIGDFQAYQDFTSSFVDLEGNTRLNDDPGMLNQGVGAVQVLDVGAYEFQGASCRADINGDGVVDTADLGILIGGFGSFCP